MAHFESAERKLSTQNPVSSETVLCNEGEIKTFSMEKNLKNLSLTDTSLKTGQRNFKTESKW